MSSLSAPEVSCSDDSSSSKPLTSLSSLSGFKGSILEGLRSSSRAGLCFIFFFAFKSFVGTSSVLSRSSRQQLAKLRSTACTEVEGAAPSFFADFVPFSRREA
ncbi:hypothetical protein ILYODFUR_021677 [Ilyodon furcidens]|uniref:Uncharacterized protein n=1 Tax=Ilyodon furcidens TaxID=33524 RepID=A0ABV0UI39_9TELE